MKTLAIESSCDDTSLSVVDYTDGYMRCESLLTFRQKFHNDFGGVVPELASRAHAQGIIGLFEQLLQELTMNKEEFFQTIDSISVTNHPGLSGSLMIGKTFAKILSLRFHKPLYYINHCYGHVFSLLLDRDSKDIPLPMLVLSASGGHTNLYLISDSTVVDGNTQTGDVFGPYSIKQISSTRDDSAGEAYDKVARLLSGPYPGGKWIDEQAAQYRSPDLFSEENSSSPFKFKRILLEKDSLDFSFSGMKSQAQHYINHYNAVHDVGQLPTDIIQEVAYEFQEAMTDILCEKLIAASERFAAKSIGLVGGVSPSKRLTNKLVHLASLPLISLKKFVYCTDNAAMIGAVGLLLYQKRNPSTVL